MTRLVEPVDPRQWNTLLSMVEINDTEAHHLEPVSKILLTGLPGTGKTTLAVQLARRLHMRMLKLRADRLISSKLGETQHNIALVFDLLRDERQHPQLLLIDEADMLLSGRTETHTEAGGEMRRVTNTILQAMDTWNPTHMLVAATNLDRLIDPAAKRRFDLTTTMPAPDQATAKRLIDHRLNELDLHLTPKHITALASKAEGLAPALIVRAIDNEARDSIIAGHPLDAEAIGAELTRQHEPKTNAKERQ